VLEAVAVIDQQITHVGDALLCVIVNDPDRPIYA